MADSSPLRMLVISQNFPQVRIAWPGEFLVRQARFLKDFDIECSFVVPRPWTPWPLYLHPRWRDYGPDNDIQQLPDIEARRVSFVRPPGVAFVPYEGTTMRPVVLRAARQLHRAKPFDLVLGVQMNGEARSAVAVGRALDLPVATLAIGTDVMVLPDRIPALWDQLAETLRHVDLPMAVSKRVAEQLERTGACRRKPFVTRLARDATRFAPAKDRGAVRRALGFAPDAVVGVYVGRLEAAKGMAEICTVLPDLLRRFPHFRMVCLGDGSFQARLLGIGPAVTAPGRVAPDDVPQYLQAADLMIFPSHSEGLPQAVLEAMNCGLPVVATDVGGTSEAVLDGVTGLLVSPRAAPPLADAAARLIDDARLRAAMGERGRRHAEAEFDPVAHSEALAKALRAVARRGRA